MDLIERIIYTEIAVLCDQLKNNKFQTRKTLGLTRLEKYYCPIIFTSYLRI